MVKVGRSKKKPLGVMTLTTHETFVPTPEVVINIDRVSSRTMAKVDTTIYEPPHGKTNNVVSEQV